VVLEVTGKPGKEMAGEQGIDLFAHSGEIPLATAQHIASPTVVCQPWYHRSMTTSGIG